jgi:hypothetical protein
MIGFFTKTERVAYGVALQPYLLPKIKAFLNDEIQETEYQFSLLDFKGLRTWAELKVRTEDYHYTDSKIHTEGWIIPACKFIEANWEVSKGKDVYFFYLWVRDGSLWVFKYNPAFMNIFPLAIPDGHKENQLHYYVAQEFWKKIDVLDITQGFMKPRSCLIEDD